MRKMSGKYKKITKDRILKNFFKLSMCCGVKHSKLMPFVNKPMIINVQLLTTLTIFNPFNVRKKSSLGIMGSTVETMVELLDKKVC
jgi:hypothetical protein